MDVFNDGIISLYYISTENKDNCKINVSKTLKKREINNLAQNSPLFGQIFSEK